MIFVQGGGSAQFTMAPMNLCVAGKPVDVLHTGMWTGKAHRGAEERDALPAGGFDRGGEIHAGAAARTKFSWRPTLRTSTCARTIRLRARSGHSLPETGEVPLVADMSSDILSRPMDVKRFGLIFAGAQKNLGPSGATVVIVRKDLAERADKNLPTVLQYRTHIKEKSLYHTPPTFAVYIVGLVLEWIEAEGGVAAIEKRNEAKAKLLYDAIDSSGGYYTVPDREGFAVEDECDVPRGGRRRGGGEEIREGSGGGEAGGVGRASVGGWDAGFDL